jgi:uncharacterized protein YndB with AHSA1/START domain
MSSRAQFKLGPTLPAEIQKNGEEWTLVLVRELRHPPARVWEALTDPEHLREWAPFDADRSLAAGATVKFTTIGAPKPHVVETQIKRADPPKALEYNWGGGDMRWELEPLGAGGTKLTLWAQINKNFISMGASGWHVCFDVLDRFLAGDPVGRLAGPAAMQIDGWQQLLAEYSKKLGVEPPRW